MTEAVVDTIVNLILLGELSPENLDGEGIDLPISVDEGFIATIQQRILQVEPDFEFETEDNPETFQEYLRRHLENI